MKSYAIIGAAVAALGGCTVVPSDNTPGNVARIYAVDSAGSITQQDTLVWANSDTTVTNPASQTQYANNEVPGSPPSADVSRQSPMPASYGSLRIEFTRPLADIFAGADPSFPVGAGGSTCGNSPQVKVRDVTAMKDIPSSTCYNPSSPLNGGPNIVVTLGSPGAVKDNFACTGFNAGGGVPAGDKLEITFTGVKDVNGNAINPAPIDITVGKLDLLYAGYNDPDLGFTKFFLKGENAAGFLKDVTCSATDQSGCVGTAANPARGDITIDIPFSAPLDGTKMGFDDGSGVVSQATVPGGSNDDSIVLASWFELLDADSANAAVPGSFNIDSSPDGVHPFSRSDINDGRIVHFSPASGLLEGSHHYTLKIHKKAAANSATLVQRGAMLCATAADCSMTPSATCDTTMGDPNYLQCVAPVVMAGDPIIDQNGNTLANDYTVNITTAAPGFTPITLASSLAPTSVDPNNGQISVDPRAHVGLSGSGDGQVNITFPAMLDPASVSSSTFKLLDDSGAAVAGTTTSVDTNNQQAHLAIATDLKREKTYTVDLNGASYKSKGVTGPVPEVKTTFVTGPLVSSGTRCYYKHEIDPATGAPNGGLANLELSKCKDKSANNPVAFEVADHKFDPAPPAMPDSTGYIQYTQVRFNGRVDSASYPGLTINTVSGATLTPVPGVTASAAGSHHDRVNLVFDRAHPMTYGTTYVVKADTTIKEEMTGATLHKPNCDPTMDIDRCAQTFKFSTTAFKFSSASESVVAATGFTKITLTFSGPIDPATLAGITVTDSAGAMVGISSPKPVATNLARVSFKTTAALGVHADYTIKITGVKAAKLGDFDPMATAPEVSAKFTTKGCP